MRPTPFRLLAGRSTTLAAMLMIVSTSLAQNERVQAGVQSAGSALAQGGKPSQDGVVLLGGSLPGGAVISSAVASLTPVAGGGGAASASYAATGRAAPAPVATSPIAGDGTFSFKGLKPGAYEFRISFAAGPRQTTDTSATRQTQGATFGEKVQSGMQTAGAAKTKHDTAKNSIGNIKAHEEAQAGGVSVAAGDVTGDGRAESAAKPAVSSVSTMAGGAGGGAASASYAKIGIDGSMPNRISMNVTVPKQNFTIVSDGDPVVVQVGADGTLTGRASVQAQQGAEPATSGRTTPDPASPSGGPPPRPTGG